MTHLYDDDDNDIPILKTQDELIVLSVREDIWKVQTLLRMQLDQSKARNRLLADIKYWVQFSTAGIFLIAFYIWWYK